MSASIQEEEMTVRRISSDVPLTPDTQTNPFLRFGKFLKNYFGQIARPQTSTGNANSQTPKSPPSSKFSLPPLSP